MHLLSDVQAFQTGEKLLKERQRVGLVHSVSALLVPGLYSVLYVVLCTTCSTVGIW